MHYESNPQHKQSRQRGCNGSLCPETPGSGTARGLLSYGKPMGDKHYAVHEGRAYCAQEHGADAWHVYPVGRLEMPAGLRREQPADGHLGRNDTRKRRDG